MSQFLYYIPGGTGHGADLDDFGISHVGDGCTVDMRGVNGGPDKDVGFIAKPVGEGKLGYYPDEQTWWPVFKRGDEPPVWLGMYTDAPPAPRELLKKHPVNGVDLELGDGNVWHVPEVMDLFGAPKLPIRYQLDPQGRETQTIMPRYIDAAEKVEAHRHWWWNETQRQRRGETENLYRRNVEDLIETCVAVLSVNYRVTRAEVMALGLLTTDTRWRIIEIAFGHWREIVAKAQEASE